jgi:hypothetical protein
MSNRKESGSVEPYFYVALVLRGTEKQYLNALKYLQSRNGAHVIYQCKSLTYLRVVREDGVQLVAAAPELATQAQAPVRRGGGLR